MNTDNMSPIDKEAPTTAAATVLTPPAPQPAVAEKPADVYDILNCNTIVFAQAAVQKIEEVYA